MAHRYDHLEDSEREWLRSSRQRAARRTWLLIAVLVLAAIGLAWLTLDGPPGARPRSSPTAEQRVVSDAQAALDAWGRFAITNDLGGLGATFWTNGPQYRLLAKEAKARKRPIGPPPYTFAMSGTRVLAPASDQRVLRGHFRVVRPGEAPQAYDWDVWLRMDGASGRWKLWTVQPTAK